MNMQRLLGMDKRGPRAAAALMMASLLMMAIAPPSEAQRQAQLPWWDRASEQHIGRYWIKSDLPAAQTRQMARHLNFMYDQYAQRLGPLPVRVEEKLNVLLFRDRHEFAMTLRARFAVNVDDRRGLFFASLAGPGLALCADGLSQRAIDQLLQREGFHLFAHSRFGNDLPPWIGEGLAELFGRSVMVNDALLMGQATPRTLRGLKEGVELGAYTPFQAIISLTREQWLERRKNNDAALMHDQVWSMAHFLMFSEGGSHVESLRKYLHHLNNGLPAAEAFERSFAGDINGFESQWRRHVFSMQAGAFITALERIEFLAQGILELRRRGVRPESFDSLQNALREIEFECDLDIAGTKVTLKALDVDAMTIPIDALCPAQPQFVVEKARLYDLTQRERDLENADPTPATIRTEHLRPRNLEIRWRRDEAEKTFAYDIGLR